MNLKQHNDIVQKLLQEVQSKDKQIKKLQKQISNQSKNQLKNIKPMNQTQLQKDALKKISQLNKQHNIKIYQLNQEIKNLTQQNKDLKQRLSLKNQIQFKQKEHIIQVIKKNVDRKPGSQNDIKITSLITHYEEQMNKKNNYIQTLKRQIKSLSLNSQSIGSLKNVQTGEIVKQHEKEDDTKDQNTTEVITQKNSISFQKHKQIIDNIQNKLKDSLKAQKQKDRQLTDLRLKYNELTKQYYRIVNQYGVSSKLISIQNKNVQNKKAKYNSTNDKINNKKQIIHNPNLNTKLSFSLTQQLHYQDQNFLSQIQDSDANITLNFQQNFKKFNNRPKISTQQYIEGPLLSQNQQTHHFNSLKRNHPDYSSENKQQIHLQKNLTGSLGQNSHKTQSENTLNVSKKYLDQITQILNLTSEVQIIPYLSNLMIKINSLQLNESIIQHLHEFFYKFGMGRVPKNSLIDTINMFEIKCNFWIESDQLLNQICIQVGAKKQKLIQKINQYKHLEQEYLQKMKNVSFLGQLTKSQKVLQFITFFDLDKSQLQLPEQLRNIYQQLKFVDRFVKQANSTLNISLKQSKTLQQTLQRILRKLQKYYQWQIQIQKQNERKNFRKIQKNKQPIS